MAAAEAAEVAAMVMVFFMSIFVVVVLVAGRWVRGWVVVGCGLAHSSGI
jgi:hypothetical protein